MCFLKHTFQQVLLDITIDVSEVSIDDMGIVNPGRKNRKRNAVMEYA